MWKLTTVGTALAGKDCQMFSPEYLPTVCFFSISDCSVLGDSLDLNLRTASLASDISETSFVQDALGVDLADYAEDMTGRGCLLKFAGPDDEPVFFYVAGFKDESFGMLAKHGDSVVHTMDPDNRYPGYILGEQPICGYAVVTESDSPEFIGDTHVYFFTGDASFSGASTNSLWIPTASAERMAHFLSSPHSDPGILSVEEHVTTLLDEIEDSDFQLGDGENGREASTVWMGDNRSLIVSSSGKAVAQFDANTDDFEFLDFDPDVVEQRGSVLMTLRATQADKDNLGCV